MDEEIEQLIIGIRADTRPFARDVSAMKSDLETGLGRGVDSAAKSIEAGLTRALKAGKLGFDDLKAVAINALASIADEAIRGGVGALFGGGAGSAPMQVSALGGGQWPAQNGVGIGGLLSGMLSGLGFGGLFGGAGRAIGGPVAPGRAFLVGERGPEVFVPGASGRVTPLAAPGPGRDIKVSIAIQAQGQSLPAALTRSSRQVARAVRSALASSESLT